MLSFLLSTLQAVFFSLGWIWYLILLLLLVQRIPSVVHIKLDLSLFHWGSLHPLDKYDSLPFSLTPFFFVCELLQPYTHLLFWCYLIVTLFQKSLSLSFYLFIYFNFSLHWVWKRYWFQTISWLYSCKHLIYVIVLLQLG